MNKKGGERLFAAIGEIDERFIAEADTPYEKRGFNPRRYGAIAAILLITVTAGLGLRLMLGGGKAFDGNYMGGDFSGGSSAPESNGSVGDVNDGAEDGSTGKPDTQKVSSEAGTIMLIESSGTKIRLKLILHKDIEAAPTPTLRFAGRDGKTYLATSGTAPEGYYSLGSPKITVDGEEKELPTNEGLYDLVIDYSELINDNILPYPTVTFTGFEGEIIT